MKYYGHIGYVSDVEISPGVWDEVVEERATYGDIYRKSRSLNDSGYINSEIGLSMEISILADPYARNHINDMRYITVDGVKWTVTSANTAEYPRIILSLGGVYNDGVSSRS
jgi:hypothetical protein